MSNTAVIELQAVEFRWPKQSQPTLLIPQLQVQAGEHLFIRGPSGCGKSTLLNLLTGINVAQAGRVSLLGQDLAALNQSQRDQFRADNIGYIFQQFNLLPYLSVRENVLLACHFSKQRKQQAQALGELTAQASELLQRLRLPADCLHKKATELSIGQQQRVAAARALIGQPKIIIADEPTSALDHDNRSAFIELLSEQAQRSGATLVFVSHDTTLTSHFHRSIDLPSLNQAGVSAA